MMGLLGGESDDDDSVAEEEDEEKLRKRLCDEAKAALKRWLRLGIDTSAFLRTFIEKAAKAQGFHDSLVLDNPTCMTPVPASFTAYVARLVEQLDAADPSRARRIVIVAHSMGNVGAYGLAARIGSPRVVAFYAVACRAPHVSTLDDFFEVNSRAGLASHSDQTLLERMNRAWPNQLIGEAIEMPPAAWPPIIKAVLKVVREQYSSPAACFGSSEAVSFYRGEPPLLRCPVTVIAGGNEAVHGETRDKLLRWKEIIAPPFDAEFVLHVLPEYDHFSIFKPDFGARDAEKFEVWKMIFTDAKRRMSQPSPPEC